SNSDRPAGGEILFLALLRARYASTASDTRESGDLERSGGDPAYLWTERGAAQWHCLRGRGLDQPCDPRSDAGAHRHYQQPTGGRELGDSGGEGAGSGGSLNTTQGPSWVTSVVNAIGNSPYWANTAIFITWDDWGGWYDHVPPPQVLVNCA